MRALGTHVYAGGFYLGLQAAGAEMLGTMEEWEEPFDMAKHFGINHLGGLEGIRKGSVDLVFGNPPCSRFSSMSVDRYTKAHREDVSMFSELQWLFKHAREVDAPRVWWETGPLASTESKGFPLIRSAHEQWVREWGRCTTLIFKIDNLYYGHPQKRPRTHVFHLRDAKYLPKMPKDAFDSTLSLYDRIQACEPADQTLNCARCQEGMTSPVRWAADVLTLDRGFHSCWPTVYSEVESKVGRSVLGCRQNVWYETDRWWTLGEYAALCGWPTDADYTQFNGKNPYSGRVIMLLSKGITPGIGTFLYNHVLENPNDGEVGPTSNPAEDVYFYRLLSKQVCYDNLPLLADKGVVEAKYAAKRGTGERA